MLDSIQNSEQNCLQFYTFSRKNNEYFYFSFLFRAFVIFLKIFTFFFKLSKIYIFFETLKFSEYF